MGRKICAAPGCESVALADRARCAPHQAEADRKLADRRQRAKAGAAARAGAALYATQRWQRAARKFLARNPLCADCGELGAVEAATEVDHIEPHRGDPKLFWDRSNWQPLCKRCHSRKTAREVFHPGGG